MWLRIAEDHGNERANAFIKKIEHTLQTLSRQPEMGRARPELRADLRSLPANPYILFYQPIDDGILLIRVIHGRRDLDTIFDEATD